MLDNRERRSSEGRRKNPRRDDRGDRERERERERGYRSSSFVIVKLTLRLSEVSTRDFSLCRPLDLLSLSLSFYLLSVFIARKVRFPSLSLFLSLSLSLCVFEGFSLAISRGFPPVSCLGAALGKPVFKCTNEARDQRRRRERARAHTSERRSESRKRRKDEEKDGGGRSGGS